MKHKIEIEELQRPSEPAEFNYGEMLVGEGVRGDGPDCSLSISAAGVSEEGGNLCSGWLDFEDNSARTFVTFRGGGAAGPRRGRRVRVVKIVVEEVT